MGAREHGSVGDDRASLERGSPDPPCSHAPKRLRRVLLTAGVTIFALLFCSFWLDRMLPILGVPLQLATPYAYPAGAEIERTMLEYELSLKTNSAGLRDADSARPFPAEWTGQSMLVLGDGQTAGRGVAFDKTFCARIGKELPDSQVINAGVASSHALRQARLYHALQDIKPRVVLVCVSGDDLADMVEWKIESPLPKPKIGDVTEFIWPNLTQHLSARERAADFEREPEPFDFIKKIVAKARKKRGLTEDDIRDWLAAVKAHPKLVEAADERRFNGNVLSFGLLWKNRWADALDLNPWRYKKAWKNIQTVLAWLDERLAERGGTLAVTFIPAKVQYDPAYFAFLKRLGYRTTPLWLTDRSRFQLALGRWCGDNGIPFHDLTPAFRSAPKAADLSRKYGAELTEAGHELVAKELTGFVRAMLPKPVDIGKTVEQDRQD
jgi:hypothetical protein